MMVDGITGEVWIGGEPEFFHDPAAVGATVVNYTDKVSAICVDCFQANSLKISNSQLERISCRALSVFQTAWFSAISRRDIFFA